MRVETPQICWHGSDSDFHGRNAPLFSLSVLESGLDEVGSSGRGGETYGHVLATCGNDPLVHLWKLSLKQGNSSGGDGGGKGVSSNGGSGVAAGLSAAVGMSARQKSSSNNTNNSNSSTGSVVVTHLTSLSGPTRRGSGRCVNSLAFSPDGLHLACAGDGGVSSIAIYSIPPLRRGNDNGRHHWSTVTREADLCLGYATVRGGVYPQGGGSGGKKHQNKAAAAGGGFGGEDVFDLAWCPSSEQFVVGCLDHSILLFQQDPQAKKAAAAAVTAAEGEATNAPSSYFSWRCVAGFRDHAHYVQGVAWDPLGTYVVSQGCDRMISVYASPRPRHAKHTAHQAKKGSSLPAWSKKACIKYWQDDPAKEEPDEPEEPQEEKENTPPKKKPPKRRRHLFADETTVESFFRRLAWTPDGAFLLAPSALYCAPKRREAEEEVVSFGTFVFARHEFDNPVAVLAGLDKPSVAVRPCPLLFKLPPTPTEEEEKKCDDSTASTHLAPNLPYRTIFAVLTLDTIFFYDTFHSHPLAVARGLHYASLTDGTWTKDGRHFWVTSSDGYVSVVSFEEGELGEVYEPLLMKKKEKVVEDGGILPCASGEKAAIVAPKMKRIKVSPAVEEKEERSEEKTVVAEKVLEQGSSSGKGDAAKTSGSTSGGTAKSKKKRITPTLLSCASSVSTTEQSIKTTKEDTSTAKPASTDGTADAKEDTSDKTHKNKDSDVDEQVNDPKPDGDKTDSAAQADPTEETAAPQHASLQDKEDAPSTKTVAEPPLADSTNTDTNSTNTETAANAAASASANPPPRKKKKRIQPTLLSS